MEELEVINIQLQSALWECCSPQFAKKISGSSILKNTAKKILNDAIAFSAKDPAASNNILRVLNSYTSFKAVLHYRLAHALLNKEGACWNGKGEAAFLEIASYADLISSRGKLLSGAEIHNKSLIGQRFVLDHGVGTVIGETTIIGNDCYILGGVTLGAVGIAGNQNCKRHPIIGNKVQIGAFARIFGCVHIGEGSFIGPHCIVTQDIPAYSVVTVRAKLQVTRLCRT
ncbi:MAG: serine O-acetyltransferase [Burkholderiaceae bacterium]|nr:serine O-acetyltransferase [Burkholderiaceae bacterium]